MELEEAREVAVAIARRRGVTWSPEDREDVVQDALIKYDAARSTAALHNPAAWLETVIGNLFIDRSRAEQRRREEADDIADGDDPIAVMFAAPVFASLEAMREEVISNVLDLISADDADLLRQRYLGNRSAGELAEELGITTANLDQLCTRAKRALREALGQRPDLVEELHRAHPHVYRSDR